MRRAEPDDTRLLPGGGCACGADLACAADLGAARSFQQLQVPEPSAERIEHDLHETVCGGGRHHVAARPAGAPDSPASIGRPAGPAVDLLVFQHVPVERCRELTATRRARRLRRVHRLLPAQGRRAGGGRGQADRVADHRRPGRWVRRDDAAGRAAGQKKTRRARSRGLLAAPPGRPDLGSFRDFGILPDFACVVVSDRYATTGTPLGKPRRAPGLPSHILRDLEDAAETYPDVHWPAQAQRALRGPSTPGTTPATTAWPRSPPTRPPRWSPSSAAPAPSACPPCPASPARRRRPPSTPAATCWNSAAIAKTTCSAPPPTPGSGRRTTSASAENGPRRPSRRSPAGSQRRRDPGPAGHPQLHRHRAQTRPLPLHVLRSLFTGKTWQPPDPLRPDLTPRPARTPSHNAHQESPIPPGRMFTARGLRTRSP